MPKPVPPVTPTSGGRLRKLREDARLTRTELAAASGVTATTIYRAETDRRGLGAETLRKIADALAVSTGRPVAELLEELTRHE